MVREEQPTAPLWESRPLLSEAVKALLFIVWMASAFYCVMSAWCLASFFRRAKSQLTNPSEMPPMTVMKPVRGADGDTYENLKSFILQDYPRFQVVFGVGEADDPAAQIIERLIDEHPQLDLQLVVSGVPVGTNMKVSNLHYMDPMAKYGILVIADADMRVGRDYLAALASDFRDPSVGLVTCPYRGAYPGNFGAAFEALTIDTDFLPSVAVAERLEGLSFALGATMAVRREALETIGGFGVLADHLADDYQLGNRVMKAGYRLRLSGYVVDSVGRKESLYGFFSHQLRWGRTYRVSRPAGWFMSGITRLTAISLLFLAATWFSQAGWAVVAAGVSLRYLQAFYVEAFLVRGPGVLGYIWLLPLRDVTGFVVWFLSFTGNRVSWKNGNFRMEKDGTMVRL